MIAGVVQLSSQDDVLQNLQRAAYWTVKAAHAGANLVVLPENFAFFGEEARKRELAEPLDGSFPGPILTALCDVAVRAQVFVIGGGMPEKSPDFLRPYNSSVLISPEGRIVSVYRKIHLFDVTLPDGTAYRESASTYPGTEVASAEVMGERIGMTICYDMRFPELFRRLIGQGARVVTVPSAFTLLTGKDHWHALLRARAIENQVYVLAAAQHGKHPKGRQTYGKSLICDPWGDVVAQVSEGEGFAMAPIDDAYIDRVRTSLPCLSHRRF